MISAFLAEVDACLTAGPEQRAEMLAELRAYLEGAEEAGNLPEMLEQLGPPQDLAARLTAGGGGRHRHLEEVRLPDGTSVWAASFGRDYERARRPDTGLYLDARWSPPWEHEHLDWPDFGAPADLAALRAALARILERARQGAVVEVGCLGGHGRTGTALACLAVLAGLESDPVDWVRAAYCERAVETAEQAALVRSFAAADPGPAAPS